MSSTSRKREKRQSRFSSFQRAHFVVLRSWFKLSSGRSWVYETSKLFKHILHHMELIWKHPDPNMRSKSLNLYSKLVLLSFYFTTIDLEMRRDGYMHSTRYRAWERSNSRFATQYPSKYFFYFLIIYSNFYFSMWTRWCKAYLIHMYNVILCVYIYIYIYM